MNFCLSWKSLEDFALGASLVLDEWLLFVSKVDNSWVDNCSLNSWFLASVLDEALHLFNCILTQFALLSYQFWFESAFFIKALVVNLFLSQSSVSSIIIEGNKFLIIGRRGCLFHELILFVLRHWFYRIIVTRWHFVLILHHCWLLLLCVHHCALRKVTVRWITSIELRI